MLKNEAYLADYIYKLAANGSGTAHKTQIWRVRSRNLVLHPPPEDSGHEKYTEAERNGCGDREEVPSLAETVEAGHDTVMVSHQPRKSEIYETKPATGTHN